MDSYPATCVFFVLGILSLQSNLLRCENLPSVNLQVSYQLPEDPSKPMALKLECGVDGKEESGNLLRVLDISISKSVAETKPPVVLGNINALSLKPISSCACDKQSIDVTGQMNVTTGFLKIDLAANKDDDPITEFICTMRYLDSGANLKTVQTRKSYEMIKYLLDKQNLSDPKLTEDGNAELLKSQLKEYLDQKLESSKLQLKSELKDYVDQITEELSSCVTTYPNQTLKLIPSAPNCTARQENNHQKGLRLQMAESSDGTKVLCDTMTDGGGWTIFQRRVDGTTDFYRGWIDYVNGFGDINTNYWLGLKHIRRILEQDGPYELRIDFSFSNGKRYFAQYSTFDILDVDTNYKLKVGGHSGTARDCLSQSNGTAFSTFDADHDMNDENNRAKDKAGAWWYFNGGAYSNLNGKWGTATQEGPYWYYKTKYTPVSLSEMKFRPVSTKP